MQPSLPRHQLPIARRRTLVALLAGALAVAGCGSSAPADSSAAAPTSTSPAAPVVQAISGNQVDFADALTQDTVLWFWAPW